MRKIKSVNPLSKETFSFFNPIGLIKDFGATIAMVFNWARRKYLNTPWKTFFAIPAMFVYFLMPIDLIPDILVLFGWLDDIAFLMWAISLVREDLLIYRGWRFGNISPVGTSIQLAE